MKFLTKYGIPLALFFIVTLGFFVRVYKLTSVPFGFFCDEAAVGYNAYTILTQGTDEYRTPFPVFFRSFDDYKTPVEIYSTVPSIALFGLNEFSVRIVSVVYAVASIIIFYFLTKELLYENKDKKIIAIFTTVFLAVSPWYIHLSRIGWESVTPFILCAITGTYFFLKGRRKLYGFPLSVTFFSLGMYTYFPARIFLPLIFLTLLILFPISIPKKKILLAISITIMSIFALPFLPSLQNGTFAARLHQVSIFSQPLKNESVIQHIAINYLQHFSFDFLFVKGDIDMPGQFITRQSVRGIGELYLLQLPLILCGFLYLCYKRKRIAILLFVWLLVYPTGSMFTINESPYATRSIIGVIPFTLLSGIGIWWIFLLFKTINKYLYYLCVFIFTLSLTLSFGLFLRLYFQAYPLYASDFWGWQYGAQSVISYFVKHEHQYHNLYLQDAFNGSPIFLKFYSPNDCKNCQIGDPITNFSKSKKQLFAVTPDYLITHHLTTFHIQKIVTYPNKHDAFIIGTLDNL